MKLAALVTLFAQCLFACVGDDTNPPLPDSGSGDATSDAPAGSSPDSGSDGSHAATFAGIRVAQWSADAPAVDFCFAPHGTAAFQPFDAGASTDSGLPNLVFPSVSAYVFVLPGLYDVRIVVGGASDCATAVAPDLTSLSLLGAGSLATIALIGSATAPDAGRPSLALRGFFDDVEPIGPVALRAIHAAPSAPSLDVGTGTIAKSFAPLFVNLAFGTAGAARDGGAADGSVTVDPNGYASMGSLTGATFSAHATGAPVDSVVATGVFAAPGSVVTFVLVDGVERGGALRMIECVDNAGVAGALSACAITATAD
jgi:hypothetical protein